MENSKVFLKEVADFLADQVTGAGHTICGPTDHRAAEDGEPIWVCRARELISQAHTQAQLKAANPSPKFKLVGKSLADNGPDEAGYVQLIEPLDYGTEVYARC